MVERGLADQQLVGQHADAPQVYSVVVLRSFEYLRGSVVKSAAVSLPPLVANRSPPEVAQLPHLVRQHDVLWLYVPVGNSLVVQVFYGLGHVFDLAGRLLLRERFVLFHLSEQRALLHVLQYEVDELFVVETSVYSEDVLVVAETLDFDLEKELVLHVVFLYHFLRDFLKGKQPTSCLVNRLEHCSKLALSQAFTQMEVVDTEASLFRFFLLLLLEGRRRSRWRNQLSGAATRSDLFLPLCWDGQGRSDRAADF